MDAYLLLQDQASELQVRARLESLRGGESCAALQDGKVMAIELSEPKIKPDAALLELLEM